MRTTFSRWLLRQADQDTAIGDLARDAKQDADWPRRAEALGTYVQHLRGSGACEAAMQALERSWKAWQDSDG